MLTPTSKPKGKVLAPAGGSRRSRPNAVAADATFAHLNTPETSIALEAWAANRRNLPGL